MDVRRINDRKLTARRGRERVDYATRRAVAGPEGAQCESVSNRTRSGTPRPGHAAPAATRALPAAYVRGRHTLRHARQLALRSGVSGIRRILGCLCLCGRTPPAIRHHNMQPDSGTRSLAADVCLHMPYH